MPKHAQHATGSCCSWRPLSEWGSPASSRPASHSNIAIGSSAFVFPQLVLYPTRTAIPASLDLAGTFEQPHFYAMKLTMVLVLAALICLNAPGCDAKRKRKPAHPLAAGQTTTALVAVSADAAVNSTAGESNLASELYCQALLDAVSSPAACILNGLGFAANIPAGPAQRRARSKKGATTRS